MKAKELKPGQWFSGDTSRLRMCIDTSGEYAIYTSRNKDGVFFLGNCYGDVTPHPDCTGWDWSVPKPIKLETGKRYELRNGEHTEPMKASPNKEYPFRADDERLWASDGRYWREGEGRHPHEWDIVSEYIPPDPKYRPFANAAEFAPHRERWIKDGDVTARVIEYSDSFMRAGTCGSIAYSTCFQNLTFDDGSPFGILVEPDQ